MTVYYSQPLSAQHNQKAALFVFSHDVLMLRYQMLVLNRILELECNQMSDIERFLLNPVARISDWLSISRYFKPCKVLTTCAG